MDSLGAQDLHHTQSAGVYPFVVLSHDFWTRRLGADASILNAVPRGSQCLAG
jgi:hypothetical protein